jgi:hypothetical protein
MVNYMEGSWQGLIEVLPRHLPVRTEKITKINLSGKLVSELRFERSTSRIQVYRRYVYTSLRGSESLLSDISIKC